MRIIIKIFFLTTLIYFSCENNPATYEDCNGVPNGPSNEDNCGVCDNNPLNDCIQDCDGVWGGNATIDDCGICDDNPLNDGVPSCNDPNDCIVPDEYGSYNSEGMDCLGVCGGIAIKDECGRCNGEGKVYVCGCEKLPDGEPFVDLNENGYWDRGEIGDEDNFIDFNNNNTFDPSEEYEDLNNNGMYDPPPCDCYGNVRDCWYDANGDGIQTFGHIQDPDEPGNECPFEYNPIYKCIDINNSENIGVDCDPSNPNECPENFECIQSWVESINTDYTGSIYDDCGNCILPDEANFFRCSNGDSCNPKDENECEGKIACSSEFIDNYSGQPIVGDCLLRSDNNTEDCLDPSNPNPGIDCDCDCLGIENDEYNYHGVCGGPDIDPTVYDCDYNCIAVGDGLDENGRDECGVCNGTGNINGFCACEDLAVNTMHLVQNESETNKLYLLYKTNIPIYGIEIVIDGATIISGTSGDAAAAEFQMISYGDKIVGFSWSQGFIPTNKIGDDGNLYGCGVLTEIIVADANSITGIESYVISSSGGYYVDIYDHNDIAIIDSIVQDNIDCPNINKYNESSISWIGELTTSIGQLLIRNIGKVTSVEINEGLGSSCYINTIPSDFYNLNMLENLDLSNNTISTISNDIEKLINVTTINLSNNQLSELPDGISDLDNLSTLDLSSNQFTDFPSSLLNISASHNISSIDLSNNQLTSIPDDICSINIGSASINVSYNTICDEIDTSCIIYEYNDTNENNIPDDCE